LSPPICSREDWQEELSDGQIELIEFGHNASRRSSPDHADFGDLEIGKPGDNAMVPALRTTMKRLRITEIAAPSFLTETSSLTVPSGRILPGQRS
jgi:hypothetical protein